MLLSPFLSTEELDKRRTGTTSITTVGLINNRNRRKNVEKAEKAIYAEIKRKEIEGVEANPFIRRKCAPKMVTKKDNQGGGRATSQMA